MPTTLLMNQYSTRPTGKKAKKAVSMIGITFMIRCCIGSMVAAVPDRRCCRNMEIPNSTGST